MRDKERTPFGERLYQARKHAKLTQPQLAGKVGLSQSTIGELEWKGEGSSRTAQIATACGVRAEWLATGAGPMLDDRQQQPNEIKEISAALEKLKPHQIEWAMKSIRMTLDAAPSVGQAQQQTGRREEEPEQEYSSSKRRMG